MADCDLCGRAEVTLNPVRVPSRWGAYRETGKWRGLCPGCLQAAAKPGPPEAVRRGYCDLCGERHESLQPASIQILGTGEPRMERAMLCAGCIEACQHPPSTEEPPREAPPVHAEAHADAHAGAHMEHNTPWPVIIAAGSATAIAGLVFGLPVLVVGMGVFGYGLSRLLGDDLHGRFHGPPVESPVAPFQRVDNRKLGMWIFVCSEILLFSALLGTYVMYRLRHPELPTALDREVLNPTVWTGVVNTFVLLVSSLTLAMGLASVRHGSQRGLKVGLFLTLLCGITFMVIKAYDWNQMLWSDHFTPWTSLYATAFYSATGVHGAHVTGGCIVLTYLLTKSLKGGYTPEKNDSIEYFGIYWHFVDIAWVFIFPLFYLL